MIRPVSMFRPDALTHRVSARLVPRLASTGLALACLALVGCFPESGDRSLGTEESALSAESGRVVAEHRHGEVTVADMDRYLVEKAADWKWQGLADESQWVSLIERVAVEQILEADAAASSSGRGVGENRRRDLERRVAVELILADEEPLPPLEWADLEAYFETRREALEVDERRRVFHIFKRYGAERDAEPIRRELERLAERFAAGESFALLAAEASDSESRHQEGLLGLVSPGQFSGDFDSVVFSLEEGGVSEPIFTADGGHLFHVADVLPERRLTVQDVAPMLLRELTRRRHLDRLCGLARGLLEERDVEPLPREYFEALMAEQRPPVIMFRYGDFELSFQEFRRLTDELGRERLSLDEPVDILEEIYCSEVLWQEGLGDRELPAERLAEARRALWVEAETRARLRAFVSADEQRLRDHHQRHQGRFSRPVEVSLTRLRIPVSKVDSPLMGRLEAAVAGLDGGEQRLEDLARGLDGAVIDTLKNRTLAQMQAQDPRSVPMAFALQPGGHSPPFTSPDGRLSMLRLDSRRDAEPLDFDQARARVVEDLLATQGPALYEEWSRRLLDDNTLSIRSTELDQAKRLLARLPD